MVRKAIAVFQGKLEGYVEFTENKKSMTIRTHVRGLRKGKHGFHIHESGDLRGEGCMKACKHFNPNKKTHGGAKGSDRHAGDLGNITSQGVGRWVNHIMYAPLLRFSGKYNILGRSVIIHAGEDDLGLGGDAESLETGNSGARLDCAVIGIRECS